MDEIAATILNKVSEILELEPEEVSLKSKMQDFLVIDSVALLELFVFIERTYGITLLEKEVRSILMLEDLVALIKNKINNKSN